MNKDYNLYIIGEGEEENFLKEKILRLKLQDRVFLLGFKKNIYPYIMLSRGCNFTIFVGRSRCSNGGGRIL